MITAWRLVSPRWVDSAFDGEGARLTGGRWNPKGTPVVYLASSLALAALELLVHIDYSRALEQHVTVPLTFDASLVLKVRQSDLPINWPDVETIPETQALGAAWVGGASSTLLAVPSAVVTQDVNYLLNPLHPQAVDVQIGSPEPFRYDPRLLKR